MQIASSRPELIRRARIGDLLPPDLIDFGRARRLDATAFLVPGASPLDGYPARLESSRDDFAAWNGRVVVMPADRPAEHRVLIVDRYETAIIDSTPMGRWGRPEEVGGVIASPATDAASYMTGSEIYVDGGWTAR